MTSIHTAWHWRTFVHRTGQWTQMNCLANPSTVSFLSTIYSVFFCQTNGINKRKYKCCLTAVWARRVEVQGDCLLLSLSCGACGRQLSGSPSVPLMNGGNERHCYISAVPLSRLQSLLWLSSIALWVLWLTRFLGPDRCKQHEKDWGSSLTSNSLNWTAAVRFSKVCDCCSDTAHAVRRD